MARHLRLLPRCELAVGVDEGRLGLLFELLDFLGDRHAFAALEPFELGHLALELGDGLLEIEIRSNGDRAIRLRGFQGLASSCRGTV
jgi:hypothetical protein